MLAEDAIKSAVENPSIEEGKKIEKALLNRLNKKNTNPKFKALSDRLEALRARAEQGLIDSIAFVKELCSIAKDTLQAEKEDTQAQLDKSPKAALTELFLELKTDTTPEIVARLVKDIDTIVRAISFPGWQNTNQGQREVKQSLRKALFKYKLHKNQELFDRAYEYIEEYY